MIYLLTNPTGQPCLAVMQKGMLTIHYTIAETGKIVFKQLGTAQQSASSASTIAEVIYQAATDNLEQVRYIAATDAETQLHVISNENDKTFL